MQIDSHQHFWRIDRGDYLWMNAGLDGALSRLRAGGPRALPRAPRHRAHDPRPGGAHLGRDGVHARHRPAHALRRRRRRLGRVRRSAGARRRSRGLAQTALLVGLRPMVQDIPDDDWLAAAGSCAGVSSARRARSRLRRPGAARATCRGSSSWLDRHPDLPVVVDHGAKPVIREARLDPWRADMAALAARPERDSASSPGS